MVAFLEMLDAGNKAQNVPGIQSQVIFTASIAGYSRSLSTGVAYVPSKAGTIQQVKLFSTYLAKYNIRVNGIAPGIYPSKFGYLGLPLALNGLSPIEKRHFELLWLQP